MLPSRQPLLIVPVRDRRQHRRILTIRNCAVTMLSLAVVIAGISIYSQTRRAPEGEYGRLFGTQVGDPKGDMVRKPEVVEEGSVADQAAPDPMLIAPAAREQLLIDSGNATPVASTEFVPAPVANQPARTGAIHGTTIVGDVNGVVVENVATSSTATPPPLSGGIFKEH